jgi:hypothetical protein
VNQKYSLKGAAQNVHGPDHTESEKSEWKNIDTKGSTHIIFSLATTLAKNQGSIAKSG